MHVTPVVRLDIGNPVVRREDQTSTDPVKGLAMGDMVMKGRPMERLIMIAFASLKGTGLLRVYVTFSASFILFSVLCSDFIGFITYVHLSVCLSAGNGVTYNSRIVESD